MYIFYLPKYYYCSKAIFSFSLSSNDSDHGDIELDGEHEWKPSGRIVTQSKVALALIAGKF